MRFENVITPGKHICPKCGQSVGWHGPPFKGRMTKLYVLAFHIRRHTLFTKDSRKYPFLRCNCCYYVVTFEEWTNLRIENKEYDTIHANSYMIPVKAVNQDAHASRVLRTQDVGKFMKHGRQSSWYRKTVKAKVNPEEGD